MKNPKWRFILMVVLLLPFSSMDDSLATAKELEIAFSYDIPPFVMNNGTEGLEVDIVRKALSYQGHDFCVQQCSYQQLAIAVAQLGLDAAAAVRKTDDGTYYSHNFIAFKNAAITKKSAGIVLNRISDLKGKDIITWQNAHRDLGEEFAALFSPDINAPYMTKYRELPVQKDQVRRFWEGDKEVLIIDKSIFIWFTKQLSQQIQISDQPVYHEIFPIPTQFQVNFKSRKIRDHFNEGLKHIRKTGVYEQIFDKYLK